MRIWINVDTKKRQDICKSIYKYTKSIYANMTECDSLDNFSKTDLSNGLSA